MVMDYTARRRYHYLYRPSGKFLFAAGSTDLGPVNQGIVVIWDSLTGEVIY